jgi:hypothetical protein
MLDIPMTQTIQFERDGAIRRLNRQRSSSKETLLHFPDRSNDRIIIMDGGQTFTLRKR